MIASRPSHFVFGSLAAFLLVATSANAGDRTEFVYFGTHGTKIHAAKFDPRTGDLVPLGPVADNPRPTAAVRHPKLPVMYFTDESGNDGKSPGGVQSYHIERSSGALTLIDEDRSGGGGTTGLWFDRRSNTLLAANYGSGQIAAFPVRRDGTLDDLRQTVQAIGSGPHRRQDRAHVHQVKIDPTGRWVIAADLGSDKLWVFPFDQETGLIDSRATASELSFSLPPGSGPRHFVFHPSGKWLFLVEELTAMVSTFTWNAKAGQLVKIQASSTNANPNTEIRNASEIAISRDGRFVYVANRGENSLVVYSVDRRTGVLRFLQRVRAGGSNPWHFTLHSSGRWLLVANRDSNSIAVFGIDRESGQLAGPKRVISTPQPVYVAFAGA